MNTRRCGVVLGVVAALLFARIGAAAEGASVTSVPGVDFRAIKTFAIAEGTIAITYRKPEIDNRLFRQRMDAAIRAALVAKGLKEVAERPDITVTYQITD